MRCLKRRTGRIRERAKTGDGPSPHFLFWTLDAGDKLSRPLFFRPGFEQVEKMNWTQLKLDLCEKSLRIFTNSTPKKL